MARGWESKSVEAQQMEASEQKPDARRKVLSPEQAAQARQKAVLSLSRKQVVAQLASSTNPKQRSMLEAALADLDRQLAAAE